MGSRLVQILAACILVTGGFACGGASRGSEGTNTKDQLERIKKADSEGKKLGAKQRALLNESRETETEDSVTGSK
ncbi:MAG: hypothetical protein HZB26_20005 [Candidatus Hydrogenedentes bacterium]|nr:hypothetical protein [Candidatus Hydrogenedentota bacterium]